jgi:hypothetical protein
MGAGARFRPAFDGKQCRLRNSVWRILTDLEPSKFYTTLESTILVMGSYIRQGEHHL